MPSEIRFLDALRDDLMEAAWNQTLGRRHGRVRRLGAGRPRRPGRIMALAAALTALLTLAGGIGFLASGGLFPGGGTDLAGTAADGGGGDGAQAPGSEPSEGRAVSEDAGGTGYRANLDDSDAFTGGTDQAGGDTSAGDGRSTGVRPADDLSKIVRTANLSLVIENGSFKDAFAEAVSVAERFDGYVETSSASGRSGSVRLRVPAGRFDAAIRALRGLAVRVTGEEITGKEVTGQFVDLNARLEILRTRREVLFGLLRQADTIDETLRMHRALEEVQLQIEQIQGQLKVLKNQVSRATIVVSMREEDAPTPVRGDVEKPSLLAAWDRSVAGFLGVISFVVIGLGYLVPVVVLGGAAWLVWRRVRGPAV